MKQFTLALIALLAGLGVAQATDFTTPGSRGKANADPCQMIKQTIVCNNKRVTGTDNLLELRSNNTPLFAFGNNGAIYAVTRIVLDPGLTAATSDSVNIDYLGLSVSKALHATLAVRANSTLNGGSFEPMLSIKSNMPIGWSSGDAGAATEDVALWRDAANILALRRSTNAQTLRIANTDDAAGNFERLQLGWAANVATLGPTAGGTGTQRQMVLDKVSSIELGTASDTTLTRSAAGKLAVEGVDTVLTSRTLTGGTGIAALGDFSADRTVSLDLTEVSSATWGAGAFTTFTFDAGAVDPTVTYGSGTVLTEGVFSLRQADAANAGGQLKLLEDPGVGSNFITFIAPASIASDRTCTLVDGAAPIPDSCVGDGTDASGGSAAGIDTQVQFNDGGTAFGGDAGFVYNKTTDAATLGSLTLSTASNSLNLPEDGIISYNSGGTTVKFDSTGSSTAYEAFILDFGNGVDAGADFPALVLRYTDGDAGYQGITFSRESASPANNDGVGFINFNSKDSGGNLDVNLAGLDIVETDITNASEDVDFRFFHTVAGARIDYVFTTLGLLNPSQQAIGWNNDTTVLTSPSLDTTLCRSAAGVVQTGTTACNSSGSLATTSIELGNASDTTVARSAAGEATLEGKAIKHAGKQSMWIPAPAMTPGLTNGCVPNSTDSGSQDVFFPTCDFDPTTQQNAQFSVAFPKSWDEGTITVTFVWSHPATTTNFGVEWDVACLYRADNSAMNTAFGTAVEVGVDTGGTTDNQYVSAETGATTCAGTPAEGGVTYFRVRRVPADAGDLTAVAARLHGVMVYYTDNAGTDN